MAKQAGGMKFTGRIGDLVFYKHKEFGFLVKEAGGPSKHKIKTSRRFVRVRENMSEFGSASSCNKLIKGAIAPITARCKDGSLHNRLMSEVCKLLKSDSTSIRGKREVKKHVAKQLDHFELNRNCASRNFFELPVNADLENNLYIETAVRIKREDLPAYWNVTSLAATVDFKTRKVKKHKCVTDIYFTEKGRFELKFDHKISDGGAVFHSMCINFYRLVNDEFVVIEDPELMSGVLWCVG